MNGLEALENISIMFDELGFEPTTLITFDQLKKHFTEWFKDEHEIIRNQLSLLDLYKRALKELDDIFHFEICYEIDSDGDYVATIIKYDDTWKYTSHNGDCIKFALKELKKDE